MHKTNVNNYMLDPSEIKNSLIVLQYTGDRLDSDADKNIKTMQVLSIGEFSGRLIAEVGYSHSGEVVLFYRSKSGTSGKMEGGWYPIPGFLNQQLGKYPKGWFVKDTGVLNRYGSNVYLATAQYLGQNENQIF